jgi:hypothetical protein
VTHWLYNEFTKISTGIIFLTQLVVHWEDISDRFSSIFGIKRLFERRHHMEWLEIAEAVETAISDAEAAEQTPAGQKLISDLKNIAGLIRAKVPATTQTEGAPTK